MHWQQTRDTDTDIAQADHLVRSEMVKLLGHDASAHPYTAPGTDAKEKKKEKKRKRRAAELEEFPDEALAAARALVAEELESIQPDTMPALDALATTWNEAFGEMAYLPERQAYGPLQSASAKERISNLQHQFEALRNAMAGHAERAAKLEKKLQIKTKGYEDRARALRGAMGQAYTALDQHLIEQSSFAALADTEATALPQRLGDMQQLVRGEQGRNMSLQRDYSQLLAERDSLIKLCEANAPPQETA